MPALWVFGTLFLVRLSRKLVCVTLSGTDLLLSDYRRQIVVPLGDVESVNESRFQRGNPVALRFKYETALGREVVFLPKVYLTFSRPQPVVERLRRLLSECQ